MSTARHYKIGLLGCGTVGQGLVELVNRNRGLIRERSGIELSFTKILVRDLAKKRPGVDRNLLTIQPDHVINNGCDVVVELVGGLEPARSFIQRALSGRKHVVTANKALLAADGFALLNKAVSQRVQFGFEASVCAGIPIIRALQSGLVGNSIRSLTGILNGTCNYILTRMADAGMPFVDALREAQGKGFAEADPTLDVDGYDAAQKLKILAEIAWGGRIALETVQIEGIRNITLDDVDSARKLGYAVKQVAHAEFNDGGVSLSVHPALLPMAHPLASVRDENNAVQVKGDAVGEMFFHGKGAGSLPSASAVLSDIVDIASHKRSLTRISARAVPVAGADLPYQRYLRFPVGEPSAIGKITSALERQGIGVDRAAAIWAKTSSEQSQVKFVTQSCQADTLRAALSMVSTLGLLQGDYVALRLAA
jgi:homoserine dehydrogenase